MLENPLEYTKSRDLHDAGIVLLQMLLGKDVMDHYPDFHTALSTGELIAQILESRRSFDDDSHVVAHDAPTRVQHARSDEEACDRALFAR